MKSCVSAIIISVAAAGLAGCGADVVNSYSDFHTLPDWGWRYTDVEEFTVTHRDSVASGALMVALRHRGDYPYMDVCLEVEQADSAGVVSRCDTVTIPLADRFGKWRGSGVGTSFQIVDTVGVIKNHTTGGKVRIRHLMRRDTLPGINQVGVFFVP